MLKTNKLNPRREGAKSHLKVVEVALHKMEVTKTQTKTSQNTNLCVLSGMVKTLHKLSRPKQLQKAIKLMIIWCRLKIQDLMFSFQEELSRIRSFKEVIFIILKALLISRKYLANQNSRTKPRILTKR